MTSPAAERRVSWLELFFDLVVVVAVAQLAHLLHGEVSPRDAGLFVLLFYAVWTVWTGFTLYANVAATRTRTNTMLLAMFGIAVMAAAIPEAAGDRGAIFAAVYVICRYLGLLSWRRTGQMLFAWPAAQAGAGTVPWVVSIWVEPPARYWLWTAGLVLDIGFSALQGSQAPAMIARAQDRLRRAAALPRSTRVPETVVPATVEPSHLGERLGLFVIIVLGEAVAQVVLAASEVAWTGPLVVAAVAGFGLLVSLWWLTLEYGAMGVPRFRLAEVPTWLALPAHFAMTMGITAVAAGLGSLAEAPAETLGLAERWVLCGGLALYFLSTALVGAVSGAPRGWLLTRALPSATVPVLVAILGRDLRAQWFPVVLLAAALWQVEYTRRGDGAR